MKGVFSKNIVVCWLEVATLLYLTKLCPLKEPIQFADASRPN